MLSLRVTPWRTNVSTTLAFKNPRLTKPATWTGRPVPQYQRVGELEVGLTELALRTNGGPKKQWQTPCRFWEPAWEVRKAGTSICGWEAPQWTAEDPVGNQGRYLGVQEPVLKFSALFYPYPTNNEAAGPVLTSAPVVVANLQSNQWWGVKVRHGESEILMLGVFPPGTHVFSGGIYQTNPPVSMGPVRGGAPSGWVGSSRRVSPTEVKQWAGHYTRLPVIYIQAPKLGPNERLAVRLRDEQGQYWPATAESQGNAQSIFPFMFEVPPDAKTLTAELLILHPIEASFLVNTLAARNQARDE